MASGKIHIGTSGWSYGTWKGPFYPDKLKSTDFLNFYAQTFSCTEINSSFYHLPRNTTIKGWIDKVPAGFLFCPKMSRYVTHIKRLKDVEESLQKYFDLFSPMQKHLGPVLIQLPPSLKFDYGLVEIFYSHLKKHYSKYQFAIEGRHNSWLEDESFELMKAYQMAFVISQSGVGFPYAEVVTGKNVYLRFHGPAELFKSGYTDVMLQYYADKIRGWSKQGHVVWAFFNNTWYTDALSNAQTLERLIKHPLS